MRPPFSYFVHLDELTEDEMFSFVTSFHWRPIKRPLRHRIQRRRAEPHVADRAGLRACAACRVLNQSASSQTDATNARFITLAVQLI
jgi:hypothetical protein